MKVCDLKEFDFFFTGNWRKHRLVWSIFFFKNFINCKPVDKNKMLICLHDCHQIILNMDDDVKLQYQSPIIVPFVPNSDDNLPF